MKLPWKKQSKSLSPRDFWGWFSAEATKPGYWPLTQQTIQLLSTQLSAVHPDLIFGMGLNEDGSKTIEISAGGLSSVIPAVENLVANAPAIPGWHVVAFKQPRRDFTMSLRGVSFGPEKIFWRESADRSTDRLDLEIIVLGENLPNDAVGQIGFISLDHAVGEYQVMTKIGKIDFILADSPPEGSHPLADLEDRLAC